MSIIAAGLGYLAYKNRDKIADALGVSSPDTSGLSKAADQAEKDRAALLEQQKALQPRTAPTVSATGPGAAPETTAAQAMSPSQVKAPTLNSAPKVDASQVTSTGVGATYVPPARTVDAAQVKSTAGIQTTPTVQGFQINATQVARPQDVAAAKVAAVDPAAARTVDAATIDRGGEAEMRARTVDLLSRLEATARGEGPSAAEMQLQRTTDRALGQQIGLARATAARAGAPGLALRQAGQNMAQISADANLSAAQLRAEEAERARQGLISTLTQTRGQDIGLATEAAKLQQGARTTTAELGTRVDLANLDVKARQALEQARFEQEAAQAGAERVLKTDLTQAEIAKEAELERARQAVQVQTTNAANSIATQKTNAELEQERALAQAKLTQDAATTTAQLGTQTDIKGAELSQERNLAAAQMEAETKKLNATLSQQANLANAENELARLMEQAKLDQQAGITNAELQTKIDTLNAQLKQDSQQFNAQMDADFAQLAAKMGLDAALANQKAQIDVMGLDDAAKARLMAAYEAAASRYLDAESAKLGATEAGKARRTQLVGQTLQAGGQLFTSSSDRRVKTDIIRLLDRQARNNPLADFLDALTAYKFKYKDPARDGEGEHVGVMAQDIEKTDVGRKMLGTDDRGAKVIDIRKATGVLLAALGETRRQQNELIAALKARKGGKRKAA